MKQFYNGLWMLVLITGMYACKSKSYFQAVMVESDEVILSEVITDTDTIVVAIDTLEPEDDWIDLPVKTGEFQDQLSSQINHSKALRHGFSGFMLYDLDADTIIYCSNEHKYFVSASNTKIFTLYACLKTLQDSIAAFKYEETDTSFTMWGTADPTLMHPFFEDTSVIEFLKHKVNNKKYIQLANFNALTPYGRGWMWDDYNDSYQTEIAVMPIYGNVLSVKQEKNKLLIVPSTSLMALNFDSGVPYIVRELDQNKFSIPSGVNVNSYFSQEVPYKNAAKVNISLLGDLLGIKIDTVRIPLPNIHETKYSWPMDTVLRRMMYKSDNMLAEHLLRNAAMQSIDTLSISVFIKWINETYLRDNPQKLFWVDGSGLSRYNRFTPQTVIYILKKLHNEVERERLYTFFNKIEIQTVGNTKKSKKTPKIYGKSGTMSGVYNLSGYMITKSGKVLAYSFMNNNFETAVREVRTSVNNILSYITENY